MRIHWYRSNGQLYDESTPKTFISGINKARRMSKVHGFSVLIDDANKTWWYKKGRRVTIQPYANNRTEPHRRTDNAKP